MEHPTERQESATSQPLLPRLILLLVVLAALPLAVDISQRLAVIRRMRAEEARLQAEVEAAEATREALEAQRELVESPAFVEWWARVQARMTQEGEVAVIPVFPPTETPSAPSEAPLRPPAQGARSIPDEWRALFLGGE
ncbi:MAG TPA: hypothetical protein ENK56_02685 [Chloroflexi bacterium]|nr:hypothetical protein [Chloroflexota bacterium]